MHCNFVLPVITLPEISEFVDRNQARLNKIDEVDRDLVSDHVSLGDARLIFVIDGREYQPHLAGVQMDAGLHSGELQRTEGHWLGFLSEFQIFQRGELDGDVLNGGSTCIGSLRRLMSNISKFISNLWMFTKVSA